MHVQVDRKESREPVAAAMAKLASLVVAEEPFVAPWMQSLETLLQAPFEAPVWVVDCSSVVPSALVPKTSCHRAFTFEQALSVPGRRDVKDLSHLLYSKLTGCRMLDAFGPSCSTTRWARRRSPILVALARVSGLMRFTWIEQTSKGICV